MLTKELTLTVLAEAIQELTTHDQIALLSRLHTCDIEGVQLFCLANEINTALDCSDDARKAKKFITKLYEAIKTEEIIKKISRRRIK